MARETAPTTHQGVILPAAANLAHPADAVPLRVTRRAASTTGSPYVPETETVPGARVRRQGVTELAIRAVPASATGEVGRQTARPNFGSFLSV